MRKNILVTGASGFIGSFLVDEAIKRNYNTIAGIRDTSSRKYLGHPATNFMEFDFSDDAALDDALKNFKDKYGRLDFVIHAAGLTKAVSRKEYRRVNFEHTRRFVLALMRNNLFPGKFVYISSMSSFGPGEKASPITLGQHQRPVSVYGKSKLDTEQFLYTLKDFPFVIINPTAVYGPRDNGFLVILKCMQQHLEIRIAGAGRQLSFLHVEDLCQATFLCMESAVVSQKFLVSDLAVYSQNSFADIARAGLKIKTVPLTFPGWMATGAALIADVIGRLTGKATLLNMDRIKEFGVSNWGVDCPEIVKLGFKPRFGLEEGLIQTIRWYQEQGWLKQ